MGSEHFLGEIIVKGVNSLCEKIENDELRWPFPLIDPNKIDIGKLASEEFIGEPLHMWLQMRKK